MDDIQDFITDHHYNQAIKAASDNPKDALAQAIMETCPELPEEELAKMTLEQFMKKSSLELLISSPIGRFFLIEQLRKRPDFNEKDAKRLAELTKILETFYLDKQSSLASTKRVIEQVNKLLKKIPSLIDEAKNLKIAYQKLREEYISEKKKFVNVRRSSLETVDTAALQTAIQEKKSELVGSPGATAEPGSKGKDNETPPSPATVEVESSARASTTQVDDLGDLSFIEPVNGIDVHGTETESVAVTLHLENHFKAAYNSIFSGLEEQLNKIFQPAYEAFQTDEEQAKRYRQLHWYCFQKQVSMDDFVIFRDLGRGAFGVVSGARHRVTGQLVALKGMNRKLIKGKNVLKLVRQEFQILKKLGEHPSPFCVSLSYAFMEETEMYFGLPLMTGGDLSFHLNENGHGYGIEPARYFAAGVLLGLQHMHNLGIIYRDLKPENVLLSEEGHTKISDMGLAILVHFTPYTRSSKLVRGRAGTPGYWPPEMIKGEHYAFDTDWWSWGCMLYELICGCNPFSERHTKLKDRNEGTLNHEITWRNFGPNKDQEFTDDAKDLICQVLKKDRNSRLGVQPDAADQIMAHPFFSGIDWTAMQALEIEPLFTPPQSINAASQADLETRNKQGEYSKVVLTAEDNIEDLNFKSREHLYEMETVLNLEREGLLDHLKAGPASKTCTIL